jgi:hypothetical protein
MAMRSVVHWMASPVTIFTKSLELNGGAPGGTPDTLSR